MNLLDLDVFRLTAGQKPIQIYNRSIPWRDSRAKAHPNRYAICLRLHSFGGHLREAKRSDIEQIQYLVQIKTELSNRNIIRYLSKSDEKTQTKKSHFHQTKEITQLKYKSQNHYLDLKIPQNPVKTP